MFFALSKILVYFFMPLVWVLLLVIAAFVLKKGRYKKRLLWVAFVALMFFSNSFIADEFERWWEVPAVSDKNLPHFEMAVVLGGMASWDNSLQRTQFFGSSDRLWQAVRLYKEKKVDRILITSGSGSLIYPQYKEADYLGRFLKTTGLDSADFFYENQSRNTMENAAFSKRIIDSLGVKQPVLLVTSAFHMRRAMMTFEKAGIKAVPYSTDRDTGKRRFSLDILLVPTPEALMKWNRLMKEWVGMVAYKLKGTTFAPLPTWHTAYIPIYRGSIRVSHCCP